MERNQVFYGLGRLYNRKGNELIRYKGEIYEYNGRKFGIGYLAGMTIIELSTGLSVVSVNTHLKGYEEAKKYIEKHYKEFESKIDSEEFSESKKEYQKLLKELQKMNTSQKCNCCIKESVCKYKVEYETDCEKLKNSIIGRTTEIAIKCKEFMGNQTTLREIQNGR